MRKPNLLFVAMIAVAACSVSCKKPDYATPALAGFLGGDFDRVVTTARQWSEQAKDDPAPRYLLSLALFLKEDYEGSWTARQFALADKQRLEAITAFSERMVRDRADSPWAHFALACALDVAQYTDAANHYAEAARMAPASQSISNCLESARYAAKKQKPAHSIEVTPKGKMQPLEGTWGIVQPLAGQFSVQGTVRSTLSALVASGSISEWKLLYTDRSRAAVAGWGVCLTEGSAVLSSDEHDALMSGKMRYHPETSVATKPLDYLGRYWLVSAAGQNQSLTIPVMIYADVKFPPTQGVGAGSMYEIAPFSNRPENGLPTKLVLEEGVCLDLSLEASVYRTDNGKGGIVGIRIDEKGARLGVNTKAMLVDIRGGSRIRGSRLVCP